MNELETIVREAARRADAPCLLATVVRVSGSSYRRPGARMLVSEDTWVSGCISGGCLEGDVMRRGSHRCRDGPTVVRYESGTDEGEAWAAALGCGGTVDVLLERVDPGSKNDALAFATACFARETSGVLVTIIASSVEGAAVGARVAIGPPWRIDRPIANDTIRARLVAAAQIRCGVIEIDGVAALVERIRPSPQLFVLGCGHDAVPLVSFARAAGFRVTVADRTIRDRSRFDGAHHVLATAGRFAEVAASIETAFEPFVVILHHHREMDRAALAMALASRARYIGVLGPAKRTRELLHEIGRARDSRVHAPVGLDIGAETPAQIALATIAEVLAVASQRPGSQSREQPRELHPQVATLVLAAGAASRFGAPKQLAAIDGVPMVCRVADACLGAEQGPVGVVIGAHGDSVTEALRARPVAVVENVEWREGIASSIRAGVEWAASCDCAALIVVLADQPWIPREHLVALGRAWRDGAGVVATRWNGASRDPSSEDGRGIGAAKRVVGVPAIFDRSRWPALLALTGDRGAASIVRAEGVATIDCDAAAADVDVPADLGNASTDRDSKSA